MKNTAVNAICQGFKDGGVEQITNFPGFFSQDIFAELGGQRISINERVAFESAYGSCLAGKRSLVTMKNVGINASADPFLHATIAGVCGGLVVVVTDDTEVSASQEGQDSRHYLDFFGGLWFEPNSLQSAYEIARKSFTFSEQFDVPVVIRLTNQFFTLDGQVKRLPKLKGRKKIVRDPKKLVVYPTHWKAQAKNLERKNKKIAKFVETFVKPPVQKKYAKGVVVAGTCGKELAEYGKGWETLCVETYPLPLKTIQKFTQGKKEVDILEQGDGLVYRTIHDLQAKNSTVVKFSSNQGSIGGFSGWTIWNHLKKLFLSLRSIKPSYVVGDVGQFTVESTHTIQACLCLGSAVGTGLGLAVAGVAYPWCVVGDTAFLHSGIPALTEAQGRQVAMGIIVIDNGGSQATGGQPLISDIHLIDPSIKQYQIDFHQASAASIKKILLQMRKKNQLAVLYLKT